MSTATITPPKPSGIRRTNTGAWAAIREGRLIDTFSGVGAKRAAVLASGSNTVIR